MRFFIQKTNEEHCSLVLRILIRLNCQVKSLQIVETCVGLRQSGRTCARGMQHNRHKKVRGDNELVGGIHGTVTASKKQIHWLVIHRHCVAMRSEELTTTG